MDAGLSSSVEDFEPSLPPVFDQVFHAGKASRPLVKAGDICVGCIVWLPMRNAEKKQIRCCRKDCCGNAELPDSEYDRPVLVIKIRQRKNSTIKGDLVCYATTITTFQNTTLQTYLTQRPRFPEFQKSMPIYHSDRDTPNRHVENTPAFLLRLQNGNLRRQSYVQLQHIYKIPTHHLRTYGVRNCRAYKFRLSPTSYTLLMENLGLRNEAYEDETTLYETAKMRLEALARSGAPREDSIRESHAYFSLPLSSGPMSCSTPPCDRSLPPRNTVSYISMPGGGRSRSSSRASSKASCMARNQTLVGLNYGAINTNLPPTSAPLGSSSTENSTGKVGVIPELYAVGEVPPTEHARLLQHGDVPRLIVPVASTPTTYDLPPPTPHRAQYTSFKRFNEHNWTSWLIKSLAVVLILGTIATLWTAMVMGR